MADPISFDKAALAWNIRWDITQVTAVAYVGSSRRLAAGNYLGHLYVFDVPEKAEKGGAVPVPARRLDGHDNGITALAATADGRWLISCSYDRTVRFWDMEAAAKTTAMAELTSPEKTKRARGAGVKVEDTSPAKVEVHEAARVLKLGEWVRTMSLSVDGKRLLTGDDSGHAILWDVAEGKELRKLPVKGWPISVALSPDAQQAVTCAYAPVYNPFPNTFQLWDLNTGEVKLDLSKEFKGANNSVLWMGATGFSPDGTIIALGRAHRNFSDPADGKISLVDATTGKKIRECAGYHEHAVNQVVFHPVGQHVASCGRDTQAKLWNVADGKLAKALGEPRGGQFKDWIYFLTFSPDGKWLSGADMAGGVHIWSLESA
jgi:WD40 repeat protein